MVSMIASALIRDPVALGTARHDPIPESGRVLRLLKADDVQVQDRFPLRGAFDISGNLLLDRVSGPGVIFWCLCWWKFVPGFASRHDGL